MRTITGLLILISMVAFAACNTGTDKEQDHQHDGNTHQHQPAADDGSSDNPPVMMNNGERWPADASTNRGIADMKAVMAQYHDGELESIDTLNKRLQAEFQEIFAKCSMEGEAHDQLHNYLLPLKDIFQKLEDCEQPECQQLIATLGKHLGEYQTYFR